jgi:hypothetical protein
MWRTPCRTSSRMTSRRVAMSVEPSRPVVPTNGPPPMHGTDL